MATSDNSSSSHVRLRWSRRGVMIAGLASSASALAGPRSRPAPRVLFVCQFGTAKSAIAREVFRRRARERGLAVTAFSRGITPEDHMTPPLRQRLAADGIDPTAEAARTLSPRDWRHADIVAIFNPLPSAAHPVDLRDWTDTPSVTDDYANAMAVMSGRIEALIDEFARRGH